MVLERKCSEFFNKLFEEGDAVDAFRKLHPNKRSFTWRSWDKTVFLGRRTRIDHCIVSSPMMNYIENVEHINSNICHDFDHKLLKITWCYSKFQPGKGNFRCPRKMHLDTDYNEIIRGTIRETIYSHINWNKVTQTELQNITDENMANMVSEEDAKPDTLCKNTL